LGDLGIEFECFPADIDEKAIRFDDPEELVKAIANAKADTLLSRHCREGVWVNPDGSKHEGVTLLVTSDQVVVHEGRILEKPESEEEARAFITGYTTSPPSTVSAIVVTNVSNGKRVCGIDRAAVVFKSIPAEVIELLIKDEATMHCCGGLVVEEPKVQPYIDRIEGGMDSVMGLGKAVTRDLLVKALE